MQSAQAMATEKVAAVASGMREVTIGSGPAKGAGGAGEAKGVSPQEAVGGKEGGEGEDDIDENDPLWKVREVSVVDCSASIAIIVFTFKIAF